MTPDMINGLFEACGAMLLIANIQRLYVDKKLRGVSWWPVLFFSVWGLWNLFYYPHLEQWFSFAGGIAIVTVNSIWVAQVAYYAWRNRWAS